MEHILNVVVFFQLFNQFFDCFTLFGCHFFQVVWNTDKFATCNLESVFFEIFLDSGVPLVLVPCMSVASYLSVTGPELEYHIKGKSKVGTYLCETVTSQMSQKMAQNWLDLFHQTYCAGLDDYGDEGAPTTDSMLSPSRIIWDISTVGYVVNPNWCPSALVPTPRLTQDLKWEQDETRHEMRLVRFIYRDALLGDMFSKLQKAPK